MERAKSKQQEVVGKNEHFLPILAQYDDVNRLVNVPRPNYRRYLYRRSTEH